MNKNILNFLYKFIIIILILIFCILCFSFVSLICGFYDSPVSTIKKDEEIIKNIEDKRDVENILPDEEQGLNEDLVSDAPIYIEEQKEDEIINIVLTGMDARKNETRSRSDTIILISYNKTQHIVKMISFLRDTWVYLPEKGWSKINAATAYGGIGLLINTLNNNFDLDVQNYVQIKFNDFKKVIDLVGGIDIELTKSEIKYINNKLHSDDKDYKNDITVEPGMVHLNGTQTLWHCRNRTIGNADFSRTDRQREVLSILINKALQMPVSEVISLVYQMQEYVNMNISIETIYDLIEDAIINKNIQIESYKIPFDDMFNYANKNGASVVEINIEKTTEKLHEILGYKDGEKIENENIDENVQNVENNN